MRLEPTSEQQALVDMFDRLFAEGGSVGGCGWDRLMEVGLPLMRCPESGGGSGLGLQEAALILERAGRHEAPAALATTIVAARLLSQLGASDALASIADGQRATIAPEPIHDRPVLVPDGAAARFAICRRADRIGLLFLEGKHPSLPALGDIPLTEVAAEEWEAAHLIGEGPDALAAFDAAVLEWRLLTAAYLSGLTLRSIEDAAAYSAERKAFGKPIGAFQGVAHPLANAVVDIDGGWLLVMRAISAVAGGEPLAANLIHAADWWVRSRSGPALLHALRVFGGHGVASDQAAARRFALGRALSLQAGPLDASLARYLDGDRSVPGDPGEAYDFAGRGCASGQRAHRFFDRIMTPEMRRFAELSEDGHDPDVQRAMAAEGLLFPHWSGAADGYEVAEMRLASAKAGWNLTAITVTDLVGVILLRFGSDMVKETVIPRLAEGVANCALGYTEPAGGSDVFAAETRAIRDGDDWLINGQKIFTSQGHLADYVLLVARTDREAPKHRGITLFLVPTDRPGYSFTPLETLGGERTNSTFYDDVRVPDSFRVGPVNGGAAVLAAALEIEQNCGQHFLAAIERMIVAMRAWQEAEHPGDVAKARAIGAAEVEALILDVLARRALWNQVEGKGLAATGPAAKLFGSEAWMRIGQEFLTIAAPRSLLRAEGGLGIVEREARRSIASTIYGGTSEIQRSLVAEGRLGMPRSRV